MERLTERLVQRPGEKLKRVREKLKLTYRDVEKASQQLAAHHQNEEFSIALSRLSDIEHKGTVPTIFRLYAILVSMPNTHCFLHLISVFQRTR